MCTFAGETELLVERSLPLLKSDPRRSDEAVAVCLREGRGEAEGVAGLASFTSANAAISYGRINASTGMHVCNDCGMESMHFIGVELFIHTSTCACACPWKRLYMYIM